MSDFSGKCFVCGGDGSLAISIYSEPLFPEAEDLPICQRCRIRAYRVINQLPLAVQELYALSRLFPHDANIDIDSVEGLSLRNQINQAVSRLRRLRDMEEEIRSRAKVATGDE